MVAPGSDEQIRYDILIEAQQAIKSMQTIMRVTEDNQQKIMLFSQVVTRSAEMWGISWQKALATYKQLNAELSNQKQATIFGRTGGQDLFASSEKYINSLDQAKRLQEDVGKSAKNMGNSIQQGTSTGVSSISALRIAWGVFISLMVTQAIGAVTGFFKEAISQAKQFEATLYRLSNAERQLSLEGVEVSLKGLKKGIDDIKKAFPIFSKEDIAELVGGVATTTKELGLNEEQILKLSAAISVLNVNSTETESLLQTQAKVTNSLLSPQARSIGSLGLAFGQAKIEAKAFELQILKTGESFKDLTEREKTEIKYQIILETAGIDGIEDVSQLKDALKDAGGDFGALNSYLESNSAKLEKNTAAWEDLKTTVGQILIPFIPTVTQGLELLNGSFIMTKAIIIEVITLIGAIGTAWVAIQTGMAKGLGGFTETLKTAITNYREELVNTFFKEVPTDAPQFFMRGWGDLIREDSETATAVIEGFGDAFDDVLDDAEDFGNKIEDIIEDTANALEDLETDLARKRADLDTEYQRKAADAWTDYQREVEDINRESADEIQEIKDKHREEDTKREEEYQLKLWELQQQYLMDLEDALHERDARQIIRLQRQYEYEKEALERKNEIEANQDNREEDSEIGEAQDKRQEKLEQARIDYERELVDQQIAKQRELDDLNLWHQRELEDIQLAQQRKLEQLIKGWIDEGKITQENAQMVYEILLGYFGPGGLTDQLYAYMMQSLMSQTSLAGQAMSSLGLGGTVPTVTPAGTPGGGGGMGGIAMAEGGTLLATHPTTVTFGEVPEIVSVRPLAGGNNEDRVFGDTGALGGGQLELAVTLSPDLEARVVRKSLDEAANVIFKVNRSNL